MLREAGAALRGQLRAYDHAARYGGDEFLVVLPAADQHAALHASARMTHALARICSPGHATAPIAVSASVGAATSRPGEPLNALLQRADQALLNAKRRTHDAGPRSGQPNTGRSGNHRL